MVLKLLRGQQPLLGVLNLAAALHLQERISVISILLMIQSVLLSQVTRWKLQEILLLPEQIISFSIN